MTYTKKLTSALGLALAVAFVGTANADVFDGGGAAPTKWEDPLNWLLDAVPANNSTNVEINHNHQVVYDAATWTYIQDNGLAQSAVQHRVARLLIGGNTNASNDGTQSLTMDQGDGNEVLFVNGTSHVLGQRTNKHATLNVVSGKTNIQANILMGGGVDSSGTINVSGGELIVSREGLDIGLTLGLGTFNITAGSFRTRAYVDLGGNGVFDVAGSSVLEIGVGSEGTLDGTWTQAAGGVLRTGIDAGGFTAILVDDVDDDGAGLQGNATFEAGAILDPYDMGGAATNVWTTVMTWEGTLVDNGLVLSTAATAAGWEMQIVGNDLQVRLPGGAVLLGDVNLGGNVDFLDIAPFITLLSGGGFQAEADCNVDGAVDFLDISPFIQILSGQ